MEQRACIYSGAAPNDCFLWNIWIFYSLRKARNFYMTVPVVYNFQSLSNKIPTTLPRCHLGGFLVISFIFSIRFCFTFLFSQLYSQRAIKIYSLKGIFLLWSASSFVCDINLIYFSCDGIDSFGRNWRYPYIAPRVFTKRRREGQHFLPTRVIIEANNFKLSRFPKSVLLRTSRQ